MFLHCSKTTQRNKQIAMGRKKFNMDPKKVLCILVVLILNHLGLWYLSSLERKDVRSWCKERSNVSLETLSFSIIPPQLRQTAVLFSPFPHQGIQFLLENDLLQQTPEDIAQFLYKGEGLNKTVIGDYLGERWGRASIRLQEKVLLTWD